MPDTTPPYQIVIFTHQHAINGGVFLRTQRLSDYLNDRRDTNVRILNASIARLENPGRVVERTHFAIVPKESIMLVFEPPQKRPPQRGFIKFPKDQYEIYILLDGVEVRGNIHVQGALDLLNVLANNAHSFLPITNPTVTILANPTLPFKSEAILINVQRIRFIGEIKPENDPGEREIHIPLGD